MERKDTSRGTVKSKNENWILVVPSDDIFKDTNHSHHVKYISEEDFNKKYYGKIENYILRCICGYKDYLFKFLKVSSTYMPRFVSDGVQTERLICVQGSSKSFYIIDHFYCPKCASSLISINTNELLVEAL